MSDTPQVGGHRPEEATSFCLGDFSNWEHVADILVKPCTFMEDIHLEDTLCSISNNHATSPDLFPPLMKYFWLW